MEEIAGSFFAGLLRGISSLVKKLIISALIESACYWLGWGALLILTLGRYPRGEKTGNRKAG